MQIKLLPAAVAHVRQIAVSHPSVDWRVQYSSVTIAFVWLQSLYGKSLLSANGYRMLAFRYRRYGRPIL